MKNVLSRSRTGRILVGAALAMALMGCGTSAPPAATVSGVVTYKDARVTGGTIGVHYLDRTGASVNLAIGADGRFSTAGLTPGKAKITVETESVKSAPTGALTPPPGAHGAAQMKSKIKESEAKAPSAQGPARVYRKVPAKYASRETTPISWDLEARSDTKKIELAD
jgi:hypothetical protein